MAITLADASLQDADALTALVTANRADIEAVDPPRPPDWFIAGAWRDNYLYERVGPDHPPDV